MTADRPVIGPHHRYVSPDEDSARWLEFRHRPGDIVISTRSKHGTTWMQMICALLVLQRPDLPAPLATLSPWLDWLVEPLESVSARLEAQQHRRFVKTHTPLDGLPLHPEVTYVVVGRHPLDAAVSLYHQIDNLRPDEAGSRPRLPVDRWLAEWVMKDDDPHRALDSFPGVFHHLRDAWSRRMHDGQANVVLVHYADLAADLGGQMRALASALDLVVPDERWPDLVAAAGFESMRARATWLAPDPGGVMRSRSAFFRRGRSGAASELLTAQQWADYEVRAAALAPPDLLAWLHRDA